jgi:lysozyme
VSELSAQPSSKKPWLVTVAMTAIAIGSIMTRQHEGISFTAYPDPATHGSPYTICYGHTKGVIKGMTATQDQCNAWLAQDYAEHQRVVAQCIHVTLNVNQAAALYDAVHNLGPKVVCGSTLQRAANDSNYTAMCNQLPRWNKVNKKVWKGLTNSRMDERELCLYPAVNKALVYPSRIAQ